MASRTIQAAYGGLSGRLRIVTLAAVLVAAVLVPAAGSAHVKVGHVKVSKKKSGGATVSARVNWEGKATGKRGRDRFKLRLLAIGEGDDLPELLGTDTAKGAHRMHARIKLSARKAKVLRQAKSAYLSATQKHDRAKDGDDLYESNYFDLTGVRGGKKSNRGVSEGNSQRSCSKKEIGPGANLSRCKLVGATLRNAKLSRADLSRANLTAASLSGAHLRGTKFDGAVWGPGQTDGFAEPDDNGATLQSAIDAAKTNVDVVIYDFGGPNVVGQMGAQGSLMRAVSRGVNVRLILNGQVQDKNCAGLDAANQAKCAWNPKLDAIYASQAQLEAAAAAAGSSAGEVTVQFANNNFNITHQKTVIVDAVDAQGNLLPPDQLPDTASAVVMTGNLQAFPSLWGQRTVSYYDTTQGKYVNVVANPDYLTDPAATCEDAPPAAGGGQPCANEWAARDFGMVVTDPGLVNLIQSVFNSDLVCGGPPSTRRSNTNDLLETNGPATWSNGSTYDFNNTGDPAQYLYPDVATGGYFPTSTQTQVPSATVNQGNAKQRTLDLIDGAKKSLLVYNEEMADDDIVDHLAAAAQKLPAGAVQVVMAGKVNKYNNFAEEFNQLNDAGVKIRLIASPPGIYIHAKVVVADGTNAFMGSENISTPSLLDNRELGLLLTNSLSPDQDQLPSSEGLALFQSTFETDWGNGTPWTDQPTTTPAPPSSSPPYFPMACGPIPARTPPIPANEQPTS